MCLRQRALLRAESNVSLVRRQGTESRFYFEAIDPTVESKLSRGGCELERKFFSRYPPRSVGRIDPPSLDTGGQLNYV